MTFSPLPIPRFHGFEKKGRLALSMFTGFPCTEYIWDSGKADLLFEELQIMQKSSTLICTGTKSDV